MFPKKPAAAKKTLSAAASKKAPDDEDAKMPAVAPTSRTKTTPPSDD